jgi:hypothetical protein
VERHTLHAAPVFVDAGRSGEIAFSVIEQRPAKVCGQKTGTLFSYSHSFPAVREGRKNV